MGDDVDATGWQTYRDALSAAGATWDEWNLDSLSFPTPADLAPYSVLIVFDESTLAYGDAECQILADWLTSGGKSMFATTVDWLWDLENGTPGNGEHNLYLLFQTEYLGDYAGNTILDMEGVPGDLIGGSFVPPDTLGLAGSYDSNGDYASSASFWARTCPGTPPASSAAPCQRGPAWDGPTTFPLPQMPASTSLANTGPGCASGPA
jgi:hypothetical protein